MFYIKININNEIEIIETTKIIKDIKQGIAVKSSCLGLDNEDYYVLYLTDLETFIKDKKCEICIYKTENDTFLGMTKNEVESVKKIISEQL